MIFDKYMPQQGKQILGYDIEMPNDTNKYEKKIPK